MSVQTIEHTLSGAEFSVHEHGAIVMSFKPVTDKEEKEVLFVSRESKTFPIKGGIPIQFPIVAPFGPKQDMPEGGYLQVNSWNCDYDYKYDSKSDACVQYSLESLDVTNGRGHGLWAAAEPGSVSYSADCEYTIKVVDNRLTGSVTIKNPSSSRANTFPFQILFHNFFKVYGDAALNGEQCNVKGLEGYIRQDKTAKNDEMVEQSDEPVTLKSDATETHYVFDPKGHMTKDLNVQIAVGEDRVIQMTASAKIENESFPVTCVVWNPGKKKAREMDNFGSVEYHEMIGVQPGILERQMLPPGGTLIFDYEIKLL